MKSKFLVAMVAGTCLASLTTVSAITTTGFGSIPGVPAGSNPYSGSGIPFDTSEYVQVTDLPGSDTLTLALAATQHGAFNPAPGNNGSGTYTVDTGLVSGRSKWNFDFYVDSSAGQLANYIFSITIKQGAHSFTFNPFDTSLITDNVGTPGTSAGNSESLDFSQFGGPISYDPNANAIYTFELDVKSVTGAPVASDSITVVAGTVPDTASTALLLGCGVLGLAFIGRRQTRFAAVAK